MRLKLTLRYDGTRFHGWQVQRGSITVQQVLQDAVERVTGVRAGITGCSRTDAGVHAAMFCCALDTDSPLRGDKLCAALNAHLPPDVAVYRCDEAAAGFHPRYDARGKRYVYHIWNGMARNPFWQAYSLHRRGPLDATRLDAAAGDFVGTHDFAAFQAAGSSVTDTVRTVRLARVDRDGEMVRFTVEADGFLYNMVRIIAGVLVRVGRGFYEPEKVKELLEGGERTREAVTAPPQGLCLMEIRYQNEE